MVKPGGTGRPRLAISARLAPLPPSRSRRPALPSALPSPNVNTHLPDFAASAAGLVPGGTDGFDFAAIFSAIFLDLATALAMTADIRKLGKEMRHTPRLGGSAQGAGRVTTLHVKP